MSANESDVKQTNQSPLLQSKSANKKLQSTFNNHNKQHTPREEWHIPSAQEPQKMRTGNLTQNTAQQQEGANDSRVKWKTILFLDN